MEEVFDFLIALFKFGQIIEYIRHDRVGDRDQARDAHR
jgi:hypothetical protein